MEQHPGQAFDEATSEVTFTVERFFDVLPDIAPLMIEHGKELWGIPFDPDFDAYAGLVLRDVLICIVARTNGQAVGYHLSVLAPDINIRTVPTAYALLFYLKPEARGNGTGRALMKYYRDEALSRGAQRITMAHKATHDMSRTMHELGFDTQEILYLWETP